MFLKYLIDTLGTCFENTYGRDPGSVMALGGVFSAKDMLGRAKERAGAGGPPAMNRPFSSSEFPLFLY